MITNDKIALLMQLILSSKESVLTLEQALRMGDEKKVNEIKTDLKELNKAIKKKIIELKLDIQ